MPDSEPHHYRPRFRSRPFGSHPLPLPDRLPVGGDELCPVPGPADLRPGPGSGLVVRLVASLPRSQVAHLLPQLVDRYLVVESGETGLGLLYEDVSTRQLQ